MIINQQWYSEYCSPVYVIHLHENGTVWFHYDNMLLISELFIVVIGHLILRYTRLMTKIQYKEIQSDIIIQLYQEFVNMQTSLANFE